MSTKITLKEVRFSFPEVFTPKPFKDSLSYSCGYLIPKDSPQVKLIKDAMVEAANKLWPGKGEKKLLTFTGATQNCFTDGDLKDSAITEGHMVLKAIRKPKAGKPIVVDRGKDASGNWVHLSEADGKIYSGVYGNSTVELWAQAGENPGIRCTLINAQFVKHAPAFGGGVAVSADGLDDLGFEDDDEDQPF
jgi:hypothetical protein